MNGAVIGEEIMGGGDRDLIEIMGGGRRLDRDNGREDEQFRGKCSQSATSHSHFCHHCPLSVRNGRISKPASHMLERGPLLCQDTGRYIENKTEKETNRI